MVGADTSRAIAELRTNLSLLYRAKAAMLNEASRLGSICLSRKVTVSNSSCHYSRPAASSYVQGGEAAILIFAFQSQRHGLLNMTTICQQLTRWNGRQS
jgi:hypothetical protein